MDRQKGEQVRRIALNILIELVVLVVLGVVLWNSAQAAAIGTQRDNSAIKLQTASERLQLADQDVVDAVERYDGFSQAKVDTLAWFYGKNDPVETRLAAMAEQWGLADLYFVDASGAVTMSAGPDEPNTSSDAWTALLNDGTVMESGTLRLYSAKVDDATTLVAARESAEAIGSINESTDIEALLSPIVIGESGYIVAINTATGTIAYAPDEDLVGKPASYAFSTVPGGDFDGFADYCNTRSYIECATSGEYTVAAVLPASELDGFCVRKVAVVMVVFAVVSILVMCYCQFLYTDRRRREREDGAAAAKQASALIPLGKNHFMNAALAKTSLSMLIVGSLVVFAVSWYVQALVSLSVQIVHDENKLEHVSQTIATAQVRADELSQQCTDEYVGRADNIAHLLAVDPSLINHDDLVDLAAAAQLESVYVFNDQGQTVATSTRAKSFALSADEADQSYGFWDVVNDEADSYVQNVVWSDGTGMTFFVGVTRYDEPGMVEIGVSSDVVAERLQSSNLTYQLGRIPVSNNGFLVSVDAETSKLTYFGDDKAIGTDASTQGFTASALADGYLGYQTVNGANCLVATSLVEGNYVMVCVPQSSIGRGDVVNALLTALLCFVLLIPVTAQLLIERRGHGEDGAAPTASPYEQGFKKQTRGIIEVTNSRGTTRRIESISGRWDDEGRVPWGEMTPGAKLTFLIKALLLVGIAAILCYVYFSGGSDSSNALSYIMSLQWEHAANIFSFTYLGIVIMIAVVVLWLVRVVLSAAFRSVSARVETLIRLLNSFIKYAVAIGVIFYGLSLIGVDSTSLWASAGILTLIVGLGAQSIIKDILAGIFIVFEGAFRVGDIVTIGGWTGTVLEIGIRTTKVEDGAHNIKILSNSAIGDIVNMTKKYSYAVVDLAVKFDTPLERLEAMFKTELPLVQGKLPSVVAGPYYKGVVGVGGDALTVRVIAQCAEGDRGQLTRDLTRQLLLICDHNDVAPYKGSCEDNSIAPEATPEEQKAAAEFVKEQGELAKDVFVEDEKA